MQHRFITNLPEYIRYAHTCVEDCSFNMATPLLVNFARSFEILGYYWNVLRIDSHMQHMLQSLSVWLISCEHSYIYK